MHHNKQSIRQQCTTCQKPSCSSDRRHHPHKLCPSRHESFICTPFSVCIIDLHSALLCCKHVAWVCDMQLLPPHTLLVVCLLVCWLGREAVSHVDLIRGAMLGHIPFLDMPARCQALLQTPAGRSLPIAMMKSATAYGVVSLNIILMVVTLCMHRAVLSASHAALASGA